MADEVAFKLSADKSTLETFLPQLVCKSQAANYVPTSDLLGCVCSENKLSHALYSVTMNDLHTITLLVMTNRSFL